MPKRNVRTQSADARTAASPASPADALLAKATQRQTCPSPSVEGWDLALVRLLAHNDAQAANRQKVSAADAVAMLRDHYGWRGGSLVALNTLCQRTFGRRSWGTP